MKVFVKGMGFVDENKAKKIAKLVRHGVNPKDFTDEEIELLTNLHSPKLGEQVIKLKRKISEIEEKVNQIISYIEKIYEMIKGGDKFG